MNKYMKNKMQVFATPETGKVRDSSIVANTFLS